MENLIDIFQSFKKRDKELFIYNTGVRRLVYDYKFLYEQSLRMASFLENIGIKKGDRVAIWAPNSPWWGVSFWGIVLTGAVVVPIDFISGKDRAKTILKLSGSKFLIQSQKKLEKLDLAKSVFIEDLEFILQKILRSAQDDTKSVRPNDLVELVFTSGTTGNPKGVMLTHKNLIANINQINKVLKIGSDYKILSLLPLSHMLEQMGGFLIPTFNGASIVYLNTLKPSAIAEALENENIYIEVAVPRLLQALRHSIENELKRKKII